MPNAQAKGVRTALSSSGFDAPVEGVNTPECRGAVGSSSRERCLNIDRLDSRLDQRQKFENFDPKVELQNKHY